MAIKLPRFGRFLDALRDAGVETKTARGFWGGVNQDDEVIVTIWIDDSAFGKVRRSDADGNRWPIYRPRTNHGGLKDAWNAGRIEKGAPVRVIMIRPRSKGVVRDAGLLLGKWRVVELVGADKAIIEPETA